MSVKTHVRSVLEDRVETAVRLSHQIHTNPELGFEEHRAARWIGDVLDEHGFDVQPGVAGLDTAFVASQGSGDLVIGVCAEYDALPGIGHACGHNVIAGNAVATALALAPFLDELGITLKVFGTPAEETGGGKILMLDAGVFDGTHAAMMVHPTPQDQVLADVLANGDVRVDYAGRPAHASAAPFEGRNAGDALTIAQVAVSLLRQQLPPGDQVHGIVVKGGDAPNIIPAQTSAHYYMRSRTLGGLEELKGRLDRCFEAGALAAECDVTTTATAPDYADFVNDSLLVDVFAANFAALGRDSDPSSSESPLGSTDMANVSHAIPAIHPTIGINCGSSVNHQPEFAEHCASPDADAALFDAACAMAWTITDLAQQPSSRDALITRAPRG